MKRAIVKSMAETTAWRSYCQFITFITFLFAANVIRQMAPLFSKVDSNKLWRDVQNEETMIFAKFGKDLFNISKVIGRKTKLAYPVLPGRPKMAVGRYIYSTPGPVSTGMGDPLLEGKPSRYVASHLRRLSLLPSVGKISISFWTE